jgi:hypothetical protein
MKKHDARTVSSTAGSPGTMSASMAAATWATAARVPCTMARALAAASTSSRAVQGACCGLEAVPMPAMWVVLWAGGAACFPARAACRGVSGLYIQSSSPRLRSSQGRASLSTWWWCLVTSGTSGGTERRRVI